MGTIKVHEFMALDGVIENPRWTFDYPFDPKMGDTIAAVMGASKAILLGRTTYEMFAASWADRTVEDDPGAPFMNDTPKYVVSSTLTEPQWRNSSVLGPYDPEAIRKWKDGIDGDIYVSGSCQLVRGLLAAGLVDQLHLFVYPVAVGAGQRLFDDGGPGKFELLDCESYSSGVVHLAYAQA